MVLKVPLVFSINITWDVLEMQIIWPHLKTTRSETLQAKPQKSISTSSLVDRHGNSHVETTVVLHIGQSLANQNGPFFAFHL